MSDGTPEPRTPVMIMVDASWADQSGTVQRVSARIENKSSGGACIRLSKKISAGTRLMIEGKWERFSGEARYCRKDGRDYLVGIQRDRLEHPIAARLAAREMEVTIPDARAQVESAKKTEESKVEQLPEKNTKTESVPTENSTDWLETLVAPEKPREIWSREQRESEQAQGLEGVQKKEEQVQRLSTGQEAAKERKHMRRKWFEMGHKHEQEQLRGSGNERPQPVNHAAATAAPEHAVEADLREEDGTSAQVELLSMEDVYRMAGILNPRKGYSINKIVDMLHSEHLRGLSKELKRASVLMALDAAGISVEEVVQDAKTRQDAIDSYEVDQRKQFEAQLAQEAEENVQIQVELERVKARYTERLRRNLDGMAREKATFGNWLTLKQQEAQSMAEAVDLCLKPPKPEVPCNGLEEVSLAGSRVKPV